MRIIISPAKQMVRDLDGLAPESMPVFLNEACEIAGWLRGLSYEEARALWGCSDKLARPNYEQLAEMDLERGLTPAILAYDGIAFKYMAPSVFETGQLAYVQQNLRILSGLYGALRPMDGVVPYRLEMQAKARVAGTRNLYEYWGDRICREVTRGDHLVVNLASKEYSRVVEGHLAPGDRLVTCVFAEREGGRLVQKGVYCKMARGEMVRFAAERGIEDPEELKAFDRLGYRFSEKDSSPELFTFIMNESKRHAR